MNRIFCLLSLFAVSTAALAQDQIRVGDVLDLEERIMVKKMTDELAKPNPNTPPSPPIIIAPKPVKVVYPTETLAVYGTSATYYEAELSMGGRTYTVRNGTPVLDYVVTSVSPQGTELTKMVMPKKGRKHGNATPQKVTLFAPLPH